MPAAPLRPLHRPRALPRGAGAQQPVSSLAAWSRAAASAAHRTIRPRVGAREPHDGVRYSAGTRAGAPRLPPFPAALLLPSDAAPSRPAPSRLAPSKHHVCPARPRRRRHRRAAPGRRRRRGEPAQRQQAHILHQVRRRRRLDRRVRPGSGAGGAIGARRARAASGAVPQLSAACSEPVCARARVYRRVSARAPATTCHAAKRARPPATFAAPTATEADGIAARGSRRRPPRLLWSAGARAAAAAASAPPRLGSSGAADPRCAPIRAF